MEVAFRLVRRTRRRAWKGWQWGPKTGWVSWRIRSGPEWTQSDLKRAQCNPKEKEDIGIWALNGDFYILHHIKRPFLICESLGSYPLEQVFVRIPSHLFVCTCATGSESDGDSSCSSMDMEGPYKRVERSAYINGSAISSAAEMRSLLILPALLGFSSSCIPTFNKDFSVMSKKTEPKFVVLPPDPLPDTGKGMEGFNKAISMDRQESRVAALMPSSGKSLVRPHELNGTLQRIIEAQKQQFRKNQQAVAAHAEFYKRTGSTVPALNLRDIPHVETRETIKINNTASEEEYAKKLEELRSNAAEKAAREERKWIARGWAVPRDQMYQRVVHKEQNIIEHYPRTKIFHPYATKLDEEKEVKHYDPEARRWNSRVKEEEERTNRALMGIIAPTKRLAVTRKSHQRSYVRTEKEERGIPAESLLGQVKEEPDIKQEVEEDLQYPGEQLPEYYCQMNPDVEVKQELESEPTATAYITLLETPFPPIKVEPHVKGEILSDDYPETSQKVAVVDGRVIVPLVSPLAAMKLPPSLPMDPKGRRIVRYPPPPRHLFGNS